MKILSLTVLALMLSGCSLLTPKIITVDKPIPFCPPPPKVPECANYVDVLSSSDVQDPGKVAQAYKLDMTCYRNHDRSFRQILEVYQDTSTMAEQASMLFKQLNDEYEHALNPNAPETQPQP